MICVIDDKVSWWIGVTPKARGVVIKRAAGDAWNATERGTNDMQNAAIVDWGKAIRIAGFWAASGRMR
jgi:hypothetical protein